ncbi:hypothetical protein PO909_030343 [Leuciscus waleckii]
MQSHQFTTDCARVAFVISLLSGRALQWAQSLWQSNAPIVTSLSAFLSHFKEVFGQTASELSVHDQLFNLCQANNSVSAYALQFHPLPAASGWNETAFLSREREQLNTNIRQLMVNDDAMDIENIIQKTIRDAQHLTTCSLLNPAVYAPPSASSVILPAPEPMQVDSYHLTHAERQRRILHQLCLYCGREGHVITACPVRQAQRQSISTVHPGAEGHGSVYPGGTSTTIHQTIYIPCRFKLLLCG